MEKRCSAKLLTLNIVEIRSPDLNAQLVAENIAAQLEKRISFRRAMKKAMQQATRLGAKGIKCTCGGRLGGAEIARSETYHEGTIPLQTLRADIDYGFAEAATTYGQHRLQGLDLQGRSSEHHLAPERTGSTRPSAIVVIAVTAAATGIAASDRHYDGDQQWRTQILRSSGRRQPLMLMPKRAKYRKVQRGRMKGVASRGNKVCLRSSGAFQALRARLDYRQPDRGCPCRYDPSHQAWRSGLD